MVTKKIGVRKLSPRVGGRRHHKYHRSPSRPPATLSARRVGRGCQDRGPQAPKSANGRTPLRRPHPTRGHELSDDDAKWIAAGNPAQSAVEVGNACPSVPLGAGVAMVLPGNQSAPHKPIFRPPGKESGNANHRLARWRKAHRPAGRNRPAAKRPGIVVRIPGISRADAEGPSERAPATATQMGDLNARRKRPVGPHFFHRGRYRPPSPRSARTKSPGGAQGWPPILRPPHFFRPIRRGPVFPAGPEGPRARDPTGPPRSGPGPAPRAGAADRPARVGSRAACWPATGPFSGR